MVKEPNAIKCPVCHAGKLLLVNHGKEIGLKLLPLPPERKSNGQWFVKCNVCKCQLGLTVQEN